MIGRNLFLLILLFLCGFPVHATFIPGFELPEEPKPAPLLLTSPIEGRGSFSGGSAPSGAAFTDPTTGMEFAFVKGGCFQMGSNDGSSDEKPVHEVCVDDFYLGKYEVTQGEWQKVMGSNPAQFKKGDRYPVEKVSWNDTQDYIRKLNQQTGKNFRLPTEAEWEYAARSGGKNELYAGGDNVDAVAWYADNSGHSLHPVGQRKANGLGLFDMSGNVFEWCADWYDSSYFEKSPRNNPQGPATGSSRVVRGGCYSVGTRHVRSALRFRILPSERYHADVGFRLALTAVR